MPCASWMAFRYPFSRSGPALRCSASNERFRRSSKTVGFGATGSESGRRSSGAGFSMSCWSASCPPEENLRDPVSELQPTSFEFRCGARYEPGCGTLVERIAAKKCIDVLRVFRPVGRGMEEAARLELGCEKLDEGQLHQTALVMALLRPRVWKKEVHRCERRIADHLLQHFDGIVPQDA